MMTNMQVTDTSDKRVIIAARLSQLQKDGREGLGLETQDERAREWAEREGFFVVETVADTKSGTVAPWDRKNLKKWVTKPEKLAEYDAIVAYSMDRLSRGNQEDFTRIEQWALDNNKVLIVMEEETRYPSRNDGEIRDWDAAKRHARKEWEKIRERVGRAQDALRNRGFLAGTCPWGYEVTGEKYAKTIQPNEVGQKWIPVIFEMIADGKSLGDVARLLVAEKVPSSTRTKNKDRECVWYPRTIGAIIRNTTYMGIHKNGKGHSLEVPALVSAQIWKAANDSLDRRPKRGIPVKSDRALLTSVLFCPNCLLNGITSPMYRINKSVDGGSYRCTGSGDVTTRKGCGNSLKVSDVDALFNEVMSELEAQKITATRIIDDTEEQIARLRVERKNLDDDSETYDDDHARLTAQIKLLTARKESAPKYTITESGEPYSALWSRLEGTERNDFLKDEGIRVYASKNRDTIVRAHSKIVGRLRLSNYTNAVLGYADNANITVNFGPDIY